MKVAICNAQSENFEKNLMDSLMNTGFAVITHHGIYLDLIKKNQQEWRNFFKKDQSYKNLFVNGNDSNMGYKTIGSETAVGAKVADLKEFFHWKYGEEVPDNVEHATKTLFDRLEEFGMEILSIIDEASSTTYKEDCFNSKKTILRALYYPAMEKVDHQDGAVRAHAHEDINYITLLVAASAPGLQVMDNYGEWYDVPHEDNSIVVNVGDMLSLASKGLYRSTTHRVVNPTDNTSDRVSMPLFIHPHSDVMLSPGYTAGKFLNERIAEIYGKK